MNNVMKPTEDLSEDWMKHISVAAKSRGFHRLSELLATMPCRPYAEVASALGVPAPIQIVAARFREPENDWQFREAAKDSLCRNLVEQLPDGWGIGDASEWQAVRALSSWTSEIQVTGGRGDLKSQLHAVARVLREAKPPNGWSPIGPSDPLIEYSFDLGWPLPCQSA